MQKANAEEDDTILRSSDEDETETPQFGDTMY